MTQPTQQQIEDSTAPAKNITGTWSEALINKFGFTIIGFIAAGYLYTDNKGLVTSLTTFVVESNTKVIAIVESNNKLASSTVEVLRNLAQQNDERNRNLQAMQTTVTNIMEKLDRIDQATRRTP